MTYKQNLLISLLVADVTNKKKSECKVVEESLPKYLIDDAIDTFEKFGYEMAKGVFENELKQNFKHSLTTN